jgi:predicted amidophosphoribosyltransferase
MRRGEAQARRGGLARRAALAGRMSPRWPGALLVRGRRIALVDDVVTTGATLREAARVLRRLGAASVVAIACTRAPGVIEDLGRRREGGRT